MDTRLLYRGAPRRGEQKRRVTRSSGASTRRDVSRSLHGIAFRTLLLIALLASAALYVHYMTPASSGFCSAQSGCEEVRRAALEVVPWPWFVPLVGIVGFSTVFATSFIVETRRWSRDLAILGGLGGLAFLALQAFVIGGFCWLCVVVDGTSIAVAALAPAWFRQEESTMPLATWAWGALASVAIVAPVGWSFVASSVPAEILELYEPGKINVVEYADFECPHCRRAHPVIKSIAASYPDRVHLRRVNMPLDHLHPHARGAALAAICAAEQGREDDMADILFETDLTDESGTNAARALGLDEKRFAECLGSDRAARRLAEDIALVQRTGLEGLPTTYIGGTKLIGARSEAEFRDAFEKASRGSRATVPGPLYVGLWVIAAFAIGWFGRQESASSASGTA